MDIDFFCDRNNQHIVGHLQDKIGLYCVQQKELPKKYENMRRCGSAGSVEVIPGNDAMVSQSSFRTRFLMYFSDFISSAKVHFVVTGIPRSIHMGFSRKVLHYYVEGDNREAYARPGTTQLLFREKEYHRNLEKLGCVNVRGGRNEWYEGPIETMMEAASMLGSPHTLWDLRGGNVAPVEIKLGKQAKPLNVTQFDHRRSPRVLEVQMKKQDIDNLRWGNTRGRAIARALRQLA